MSQETTRLETIVERTAPVAPGSINPLSGRELGHIVSRGTFLAYDAYTRPILFMMAGCSDGQPLPLPVSNFRPPVLSEHLRRDQLAALLATLPRHRICFGGPLAGDFNNGGGTAITEDLVLNHGQRSSPTSTVEVPPR